MLLTIKEEEESKVLAKIEEGVAVDKDELETVELK